MRDLVDQGFLARFSIEVAQYGTCSSTRNFSFAGV